jgi:hypothetical protein
VLRRTDLLAVIHVSETQTVMCATLLPACYQLCQR